MTSRRLRAMRCILRIQIFGLLGVLFLSSPALLAQAGPPFLTDDPETPGNKHWEINVGFLGSRNPAGGDYETPDFDINYGLGDRIQLKYELPIAVSELRRQPASAASPAQRGHVLAGLGESLLGIKWRFYEHHSGERWLGPGHSPTASEDNVDFSVSSYPQLSLNNPTRSVARGVVPPGPDFLLPIEANARLGPIRLDGEIGYHFGNHAQPQSWIRGLIAGHQFSDRLEAYAEVYDEQEATRVLPALGEFPASKQRSTTLGMGGRYGLNRQKSLVLLLMGGRSFQKITATNSQPSWIAYMGLQFLLGPEDTVEPAVEQKRPPM